MNYTGTVATYHNWVCVVISIAEIKLQEIKIKKRNNTTILKKQKHTMQLTKREIG